jgi:integrase
VSARANGEGSVYLRQDGRWSAACFARTAGRVRRQVYGRTRAEASQKLTVLLSKTAAGSPLAEEAWTVRSYADHWLETVARARLRPATWTNYSYAVRVHIGPSLGSVRLRSLTPARVRRFLAERTEAGLAANSVRIIHATLRTMLAEAVRDELVERNVASIVRGPRIDHGEVWPWSLDEAATFLAAAGAHRLSALFAVGVAVGLRRGELLALAWDDVDLDGGILRVRRTVHACGVKVWCLGRRSRPDRVGASRYRSPRARRCCLTVSARKRSGGRRGTHGRTRA